MNCLLDTNVIAELRKARAKIDTGVWQWLHEQPDERLFTSVLVLGELRQGVLRLRRRDPSQADAIQAKIDRLSLYTQRALTVDRTVAACWAELNTPDPKPTIDSLIAATALVHRLAVVTRNEQDFASLGVPVINPFAA